MMTPTTTSTTQNTRLFNVEFTQGLPETAADTEAASSAGRQTCVSLKSSTLCEASVTRNASSIP